MPFVRAAHRATPIAPVRPALPPNRITPQRPVNQRPPVAPRILPILQAPTFSTKSDFVYEHEEEQHEEIHDHPTVVNSDHRKNTTQQISVRVPTFVPHQNYPRKPLPHLTTQPVRHAEPKYSPNLYSTR
jgi:hypothetical protein